MNVSQSKTQSAISKTVQSLFLYRLLFSSNQSVIMKYLVAFSALLTLTLAAPDYYWRAYQVNEIPKDAVVGTYDGRTKTYIGNVPITGEGLFVGQIFAGQDYLLVTAVNGAQEGPTFAGTKNIQILCSGNPDNFEWVTANSTSLSRVQHLVKGGYEGTEFGPLYIGRVVHAGLRIGKVLGYQPNKADLYIADGNLNIQYGRYEVLTYIQS